ncbi:MAG TPA: S1C family serine protease [Polyangia bacterium]|nr:S1C family serine protease [Polyangia bacterium]
MASALRHVWMTTGIAAAILLCGRDGQAEPPAAGAAAMCDGAYADDLGTLSARAREFDRHPEATFSYCTRNRAEYECLSYDADGAILRQRKRAVMHGTAFAYRRQGDDILLLTNEHVAVWPAVTDAQHVVDGVPSGCKRVSESLTLVDDETDSYARDDVAVTRVVSDPQLDVAVLKTRGDLHVMPWKIGRSDALRERNLVEVRGFPLGAFRATSIGKVISSHDRDEEGSWSHDDFVVDALLSPGNSGSPVLAISCLTGEYELVGVFHAGYVGSSALNVVVGIDQVRDLMTTLKREPQGGDGTPAALALPDRDRLQSALAPLHQLFFPFGNRTATVIGRSDGALLFLVYPKEFPFNAEPTWVVEDRPSPAAGAFGAAGQLWLASGGALHGYEIAKLDPEARALFDKALLALRTDAVANATLRQSKEAERGSRQSSDKARRAGRALAKIAASRAELVQAIDDLPERQSSARDDRRVRLADIVAPPPPAASPAAGAALANVPPREGRAEGLDR